MLSKSAITKLQAILIIDLIIVASAIGGVFYLNTLPPDPLGPNRVHLTDLTMSQTVLFGQPITVSFNATNLETDAGTYTASLTLDGEPNQSQTIELAGSETKTLEFILSNVGEGLHVVKIGDLEGTFTVLNVFTLSDLAINRTSAQVGEPIGISIIVTNRASENADYSINLVVNGALTETKTGSLNGEESTTVLFEIVEQTEGSYSYSIGNLNGTFTITSSAPPAKPAEFQVTNLVIDPEIAEQGTPVDISVKVTNIGELGGSYSVSLSINSVLKETKDVVLSGGATITVHFSVTQNSLGTYNVKVNDLTGTLSVQGPSTISLTGLVVRPYEVWAGETITIIAKGTNQGAADSSLSARLKINGEVIETKTFHLAAGQSGELQFTISAPDLETGQKSASFSVNVNELTGGFVVVMNGYHTLSVAVSPSGNAEFTFKYPDGTSEPHTTFWSALLAEGTYTIIMPVQDPTGRYTFKDWDDGSTDPSRAITLRTRTSVTANFEGGTSCPSLYLWNGTNNVYVGDISNHGWLGYINYMNEDGSIVYYRNHPWDYIPLGSGQLQPTEGNFNLTLVQRWNEIFYLDQAYMLAVDHPADLDVYSTMVEQYLDPTYMGNIYTISKNSLTPVSAVNEKGENVLPQISSIDGVFTSGGTGLLSPSWNNITWNKITLDLGNLANAQQIKLVVRAIVDWGEAEDYNNWLDAFFAQPVPNGTEITPPPFMEVKDASGSWVRVPQSRDFPLPPDGVARTYVVDLTDLFPTNDYSLRINNFWNVTFDYIGIDITPQQNLTIQKIDPQAYLYQAYPAGSESATGNFTKYGNVTELLLTEDDMFVIGKQGDAVSLQFSTANLADPLEGMVRSYFLYEACWFKDETGNWGFGFGFTVDPLPFREMSGFPYLPSESYPYDDAHLAYLEQYNTRVIESP